MTGVATLSVEEISHVTVTMELSLELSAAFGRHDLGLHQVDLVAAASLPYSRTLPHETTKQKRQQGN